MARAAQGPGCTIYAGDPYILVRHDPQPERRRLVVGVGWQFCSRGIAQRTQVCLYKQHHFLLVPYFERTRCSRRAYSRRPTFHSLNARKVCDRRGTGRWRVITFGSYIDRDGPHSAAVRSEHDRSFRRCN